MSDEQKTPPSAKDAFSDAARQVEEAFTKIDFDSDLMDQIAERPFKRETWRETLYLLSTIPAGTAALFVWLLAGPVGIPLAMSIIGLPFVVLAFWIFRKFAGFERGRVTILEKEPLPAAYDTYTGNPFEKGIGFISDVQTWKDMGWMVLLSLVGFPVATLALGLWLIAFGWILYPLWGWAMPGDATPIGWLVGGDMNFLESFLMVPLGLVMIVVATWVCAAVANALYAISQLLLAASEEGKLRGRVTELERTREQSLTQQSTEMSRIERDLHDGAQARLVALAMDLGMAEQKFEEDPEAARKLVAEARDEAQQTLQELRELVRGIGPQILRDRGLEAALVPLAARSPIKVELGIDLPERPAERVEATAYFVCSEALANAIKHSQAEQININVWRNGDYFYVRVADNGVGGAATDGQGLSGLRARVEAVDGKLVVESPEGGPTTVDAWLPVTDR